MHCGPPNQNFGRAMAHPAAPPCFDWYPCDRQTDGL